MKRRKIISIVFLHLIVIHAILNIIHLFGSNFGHPLFNLLQNFPTWSQVVILGIIDTMSYLVISLIYARFYHDRKGLYLVIEWVVIIFALVVLAIYAIVYFLSLNFYSRDIMLVYAMFNPWFGTFMIRLPDTGLYSLWWLISTITPSIGIYIGARLGLRKEVEI